MGTISDDARDAGELDRSPRITLRDMIDELDLVVLSRRDVLRRNPKKLPTATLERMNGRLLISEATVATLRRLAAAPDDVRASIEGDLTQGAPHARIAIRDPSDSSGSVEP